MNVKLKQSGYLVGLLLAGTAGWYLSAFQSQLKSEPDSAEDYIATVNGQGIDLDWFVDQMKLRGGYKPGQFQTTEQKKALLDYLITEEIIFQQALEQGVADDPAIGQLYKKAVIDKFLTDNLNKKLGQLKVGDSEIEAYFNQNQTAYNKPARRRAAIILAEVSESDDEAQKAEKYQQIEKAKTAVNEMATDTTHFGELAKVYSDDRASMYQGGVIGWLMNHPSRKYKWDQSLIDALFALDKPGDVSDIITTDKGYYIVRLVAAENVKEKSFEQVKKGIKNQLLQTKQQQFKADFMDRLTSQAEVEINTNMLADIPALSPAAENKKNTPPAMPSAGGAQ
jgi:parvulin-like peptidyl-prolyl isomerase